MNTRSVMYLKNNHVVYINCYREYVELYFVDLQKKIRVNHDVNLSINTLTALDYALAM